MLEVPERKVRALLAALTAAGGETVPADALLVREPGGYRLTRARSDADELRCRAGRALDAVDSGERLELLDEFQALWRGRSYGEFSEELWVSPEVAALEEIRLQAAELRIAETLRQSSARGRQARISRW